MCLSSVERKFEEPCAFRPGFWTGLLDSIFGIPEYRVGYKVVIDKEDSWSPFFFDGRYVYDEWIDDDEDAGTLPTDDHADSYDCGFHLFLSRKQPCGMVILRITVVERK